MATLQISEIQLFNALKSRLGENEAEQLVTFVKSAVMQELTELSATMATRDFVDERISQVEEKITKLDEKLSSKITSLEVKIAQVEVKIAEAKFQLILWAFVFWATQLCAIFAFLKFLK